MCGCEEALEATIPCPGCHNEWYCSNACMKRSLFIHIFNCGGIEVTSADYLIRDCFRGRFPVGDAARDFGFDNAATPHDRTYLGGLNQGLVKFMGVGREDLHDWQVKDILAERICEVYEPLRQRSPQSIGKYYPWFLDNKHIVSAVKPQRDESSGSSHAARKAILLHAQNYLPPADRGIPLEQLPASKQTVCKFYGFVKAGWTPGPEVEFWLDFGFWACRGRMNVARDSPFYFPEMLPASMREWFTGAVSIEEEGLLARFYTKLFDKVSFVQFHQAYLDGSLDQLAEHVGLRTEARFWKEERQAILGLKPDAMYPSAYYLKQHILTQDIAEPINAVQVDYGYLNCRNPRERKRWREVYSMMFEADGFRFDALHKACITGKIYEYGKEIYPDIPAVFERLSKNVYPLKSGGDSIPVGLVSGGDISISVGQVSG